VAALVKSTQDSVKYDIINSQINHYYRIGEVDKAQELDKTLDALMKETATATVPSLATGHTPLNGTAPSS
jgi:hypothetical protein